MEGPSRSRPDPSEYLRMTVTDATESAFMSNLGCLPFRMITAVLITLVCLTGVGRAQPAEVEHTFEYNPAPGSSPKSVFVAGEFNAWVPDSTEMKKGADGVYRATVKLPP